MTPTFQSNTGIEPWKMVIETAQKLDVTDTTSGFSQKKGVKA
jgi:hypothetical protein